MREAIASTIPQFAAGVSRLGDTEQAVADVCDRVLDGLSQPPDLMFAFASPHHLPRLGAIAPAICRRAGTETLLGCSGESIAAGDEEIEDAPAIALWAARLPGSKVVRTYLEYMRTPDGGTFVGWPDELAADWPAEATLFVLGEPFSFPADLLLEQVNAEHPGVAAIGGMAGGGHGPGEIGLMFGSESKRQGAALALVHGDVPIRPLVSQGCRPIGKHFVVTKAQRNIIQELGGKPPLPLVKELYASLGPREQRMMQSGLHLGRVTNEYRSEFRRGDFLVRNVIGVDEESGAMAVGDYVRPGQTVQFHLRDADSADEDLGELLSSAKEAGKPRGALLFTCNGRGTRLFERPHHDAAAVQSALGPIPLAGFFAQGEIGPIAGRNFVHGFTASLALFG